jgi:lambda family phage portal protein
VNRTLLDRAIGFVSPAAGLQRARQRAMIEALTRGYDGADRGRLSGGRRAGSTSADAEIARDVRWLRDRMRDLVRNNPHAANALSVLVTHAIGDGIIPRAKDKRVNDLFAEWAKVCDADGDLDFYGIQASAARQMFESGDALVRRRRRLLEDGLPAPLQLQVIETDMIDTSKVWPIATATRVIQGIEFDALGRRSAYWLYPVHPGNAGFDGRQGFESKAVPASDIAHAYEKQRTQVRGVPWGAPVIPALYDLAEYEKAEIVRKRMEACLVGVMLGGEDSDPAGLQITHDGKALTPGLYNVDGARVDKFTPGMVYNGVGGRDIKFTQPAASGSYDAYKTSMLHTIAAGFRVPHALLSGNLSRVNYSSSKLGLESFKRTISALQWQFIIPMLCQPIWDWFCEAAYFAGKIPSPTVPVTWSPPKFYSADQMKDVKADLAEVRAGFRSAQSAILARGENPDDVLAEIIEWNKKIDDAKVILDSDPRNVTQAGNAQPEPGDTDPPAAPAEED